MDFAEVDFTLMWTVTLAGILIVFSVLLILVGIFYLFGAIMGGLRKRQKNKTQAAASAPKPVQTQAPQAPPPQVEAGISPAVVAAITAAVAYEQEGQPFVLKSVRRKQQAANRRPAWGAAAVSEHTRPF